MGKDIVSFEHFNPDIELGVIDASGHPIRPRKKPGRKPNPPSPAQRKAQNRAAQRAFRERKRYEMKEAQLAAKKSIQARNQALCQIKLLKRRIEELEYETNYLKGYTLTLKLACEANHVDVPKFWDSGATDEIGAEEMTFSMTKGIPQQLEFFLDKAMNIINFDQLQQIIDAKDVENPPTLVIQSPCSSINTNSSLSSVCNSPKPDQGPKEDDTVMEDLVFGTVPPKMDEAFLMGLLGEDQTNNWSGGGGGSTKTNAHTTRNCFSGEYQLNKNGLSFSSPPVFPQKCVFDENSTTTILFTNDEEIIDPKTGITRTITEWNCPQEGTNNGNNRDKKIFPPMTLIEAMKIVKSVKHLDDATRVLFTPTELQRTVRHDTRIDSIPGPNYRDLLILYQDYYDANELFDFLMRNSLFLGGELGSLDSWFVPPEFFKKYWFIIPCHRRQRIDNAVEIMTFVNKRIIEMLAKRKEMYIEREQHQDYFPTPTKEDKQDLEADFLVENLPVFDDFFFDTHKEDDKKSEDLVQEHSDDEEIINDTNTLQPLKLIPSNLPLSQFQQTMNF